MFGFKTRWAGKRSRTVRLHLGLGFGGGWSAVAALLLREPESTTRAALRQMKRQPASTPRDEPGCGHSTFFGARDLLTKAVAADADFPLAHAALSDVWWHTGYDAKARLETRRALELSNHLSQEQQLLVEGRIPEDRCRKRIALSDFSQTN